MRRSPRMLFYRVYNKRVLLHLRKIELMLLLSRPPKLGNFMQRPLFFQQEPE